MDNMQQSSSQVLPSKEATSEGTDISPAGVALERPQPKLHVLFLIDHLMARGGGESNLLKLVQLLPPTVRCSIATFRIDPEIRKSISVPVYVFPWRRVYHLSALKAAFALRRLIRRQHVDIVQTYFETSNLWGGIVAKLSGASLLTSRRDMGILRKPKHKLAYRVVNRISDRVLAVSEEVKSFCVDQEHIDPQKISVVYNGVDLRQLAEAAQTTPFDRSQWPGASHIITCIANVRQIKGIDVLVRCAQRVCRELPGATFLIAGTLYDPRAYTEEIQQMVRSFGLENNVKLLGFVENPTPLLKMSNAFCLLSRSEGFSNALLEAMACGLPCVITRVGGNPEAVNDGENGFLVPPEEDESAAERLLFLLRNPAKAAQIGNAARLTVQMRFSADNMIRQLLDVYSGLMAGRNVPKTAKDERSLP
jgi:glycosyltransferase involved in cell wall biosynthesis